MNNSENKDKNKKKSVVLAILGVLSLVMITAGVTYALFTYTKLGSTENTITAGTIKFLYTENTGVGKGIAITNALPVSDDTGKAYDTDGYVFDFKITAVNSGTTAIPYEITLRQKADSTLSSDIVKVYLTDKTGGTETQIVAPTIFSALTNTTVNVGSNIEKTLTTQSVPAKDKNYEKDYRLRMWIDESADFSATVYTYAKTSGTGAVADLLTTAQYNALGESEKANYGAIAYINDTAATALTQAQYEALGTKDGYTAATELLVYPHNAKTFTALVNVYANVTTVSIGN